MHNENTDNPQSDPHGPGVRIHPPLIYATSILGGIGIDRAWPLPMPFGLHGPLYSGIILALVLLLAGLCIYEFHKAGYRCAPGQTGQRTDHLRPLPFPRNPLYMVLTLVQITPPSGWTTCGAGMVAVSVIVISRYAITREELYLEQLFGQEYLDYKQRVRRWF